MSAGWTNLQSVWTDLTSCWSQKSQALAWQTSSRPSSGRSSTERFQKVSGIGARPSDVKNSSERRNMRSGV